MGRLVGFVPVHREDGVDWYGPDDDVPEDAARQIGAHAWEDGDHPYAEAPERPEGTPPPKSGTGSSAEAWALYAAEQGVDVPEGAKRDEIVAVLADAGKPVDPPSND